MERLLHHIDVITRQRHRGQLEASLATAVRELAGAEHVTLYKLFTPPGDLLVGLAAHATATATELLDDGISWPAGTASLAGFPHLQACHAGGGHYEDRDPDSGLRRHSFAMDGIGHQAFGFVVVHTRQPLEPATPVVIRGLLGLFRNCVALLDYSEIDTLTGLLNRKTFDEYLIRILSHVAIEGGMRDGVAGKSRRRTQVTDHHWLGVIDLDHFKSINDSHGHLIGDEVLILAANLMKSAFRAHDKLFRFGGEEFVVLLKPAELASARAAFERCRREVEQYSFPQVGRVTVSAGFTRIGIYDTPSVILDNADEALYYAKGNGRNRVCCYEELIAAGQLVKHHVLNTDAVMF
jgi:diguanylate cyclase (GGDEF)-like protein